MNLVQIPAEIRLQIYGYIIPSAPLLTDAKKYNGLLGACKAIRNEFEPELCKAIARQVQDLATQIQNTGDDIIYTPPTTFHGWRNLTVSRPKKLNMFNHDDRFLDFKDFNFDIFTLTCLNKAELYQGDGVRPSTYPEPACDLSLQLVTEFALEQHPAANSWQLYWQPHYQNSAIQKCAKCSGRGVEWDIERETLERGLFTGVTFYQRPLGGTERDGLLATSIMSDNIDGIGNPDEDRNVYSALDDFDDQPS